MVDIPRWPDWKQTEKLEVLPAGLFADVAGAPAGAQAAADEAAADEGATVSFAKTVHMVWSHREDPELRSQLVDAVKDLPLQLTAVVDRRLLSESADDGHAYPDGHMVWASFPDPPLPLTLYVPNDSAQRFEQLGQQTWEGRGRIVGWDHRHGRLQIRVE